MSARWPCSIPDAALFQRSAVPLGRFMSRLFASASHRGRNKDGRVWRVLSREWGNEVPYNPLKGMTYRALFIIP